MTRQYPHAGNCVLTHISWWIFVNNQELFLKWLKVGLPRLCISGASTTPEHALTRKYLENMTNDNIMLMLFTANRDSRSVAAWANLWGHSETDRGDECQSSRYWQVQEHHRWDSAGCYWVREGCWWDCAWEPQAKPAGLIPTLAGQLSRAGPTVTMTAS